MTETEKVAREYKPDTHGNRSIANGEYRKDRSKRSFYEAISPKPVKLRATSASHAYYSPR